MTSITQPFALGRSRSSSFSRTWLIRLGLIAVFVGLWQAAPALGLADPVFIGTPGGTLKAFLDQFTTSVVTTDLSVTVFETLIGFVLGTGSGLIAGIFLSRTPELRKAVSPLITAANSLPRIALAPLFTLWFGLGPSAKIALVVSFVFFVMLTTTIAGFSQPNGDFELLAGSLGTSTRQEMMLFVLPAAIPTLIAGVELCLIYSFLGAVSGEIIGGQNGLGVRLTAFSNSFEIDRLLAVLLLLVIVSTAAVQLMRMLTAPLTKWHKAESMSNGAL